jgi:hypothetical protein
MICLMPTFLLFCTAVLSLFCSVCLFLQTNTTRFESMLLLRGIACMQHGYTPPPHKTFYFKKKWCRWDHFLKSHPGVRSAIRLRRRNQLTFSSSSSSFLYWSEAHWIPTLGTSCSLDMDRDVAYDEARGSWGTDTTRVLLHTSCRHGLGYPIGSRP